MSLEFFTDFPTTFVKAITSPLFYHDAIRGRTGRGVGYFLVLTMFLAVIKTALISAVVAPSLGIFLTKIRENLVDVFPSDLELKIQNGQVSTNVRQSYTIPFSQLQRLLPQATSDLAPGLPVEENFLVIDGKAKIEDFLKYKTFLLLTNSGVVISEQDNGAFRYYPIPRDTNLTIDRRTIRVMWSRISPMTDWVVPGVVGVVFLLMFLYYPIWHLVYLIFGAFLLVLLLRAARVKLSFRAAYRVGLYSITVPLVLDFILSIFIGDGAIPLFFTLVFLLFSQHMVRGSQPT